MPTATSIVIRMSTQTEQYTIMNIAIPTAMSMFMTRKTIAAVIVILILIRMKNWKGINTDIEAAWEERQGTLI